MDGFVATVRMAGSASMDGFIATQEGCQVQRAGNMSMDGFVATQEGCQVRRAGSASMDGFVATVQLAGSASMDALPANRTWQPPCSHGTYQHEAITSHSRQLLMMGTWLPETC